MDPRLRMAAVSSYFKRSMATSFFEDHTGPLVCFFGTLHKLLNTVLKWLWLSYSSDTEDEKAHKIWKKSIMLVYRSAATHKYVLLC